MKSTCLLRMTESVTRSTYESYLFLRPMAVTELCCRKRPTNISDKATCIMKQFTIMRAIMIISIEAVSRNWVEFLC